MLYFHPWEFDPDQPRLPLKALSRFRTYVGLGEQQGPLQCTGDTLLVHPAIDVAAASTTGAALPRFDPAALRTRPMARLTSVAGSAAKG